MDAPWQARNGPLEEPPAEWFVNRKAELDRFWEWGSGIPHNRRLSYALVGLRRTGKTAIMNKVFNRLFHEQDRVLPVHISFVQYLNNPEPIGAFTFAAEYLAGYIRSYLAFYYQKPELHEKRVPLYELRELSADLTDSVTMELFRSYDMGLKSEPVPGHEVMQWVMPKPNSQPPSTRSRVRSTGKLVISPKSSLGVLSVTLMNVRWTANRFPTNFDVR